MDKFADVLCDKKHPTKLRISPYKTVISHQWCMETRSSHWLTDKRIFATEVRMLHHIYSFHCEPCKEWEPKGREQEGGDIAVNLRRRWLQWYGSRSDDMGSNPALTTGGSLRSQVRYGALMGTSALCDVGTGSWDTRKRWSYMVK